MYETVQHGRYRIARKLGQGGMGAVFEAQDGQHNQTVAIKVIRSQELNSSLLARFEREGQIMSQLTHPNIVSVLDSGQEGDVYFIVMEFVRGQNLRNLLASLPDGRVEERLALNIVRQISLALQHSHA